MHDQVKQIAMRIKELRDISGLSPDTMASILSMPKDRYMAYESGTSDIPVSILYEIAGYFKVELTALLTGDEPKLKSYALVRAGKGVGVNRRKDYSYRSLAFNFSDKKMEPFLVTVEPKDTKEGAVMNSHPGQEFNYLLEGRLQLDLDGHEMILQKGDSIYFNSELPHRMKALDNERAVFLAIILQ